MIYTACHSAACKFPACLLCCCHASPCCSFNIPSFYCTAACAAAPAAAACGCEESCLSTVRSLGWCGMQGCSSLTDAGLHCVGQISSLVTVNLQDCTDITGRTPLTAYPCTGPCCYSCKQLEWHRLQHTLGSALLMLDDTKHVTTAAQQTNSVNQHTPACMPSDTRLP